MLQDIFHFRRAALLMGITGCLFACSSSRSLFVAHPAAAVDTGAAARIRVDTVTSVKVSYNPLQIKYGYALHVPPDSIVNLRLYTFIEDWLGVPFKWGGTDKRGIDCSAFVQRLFLEVYGIHVPRTSVEQLLTQRVEAFRSTSYLSEGDLVFFRTMNNKIVSHVGVYLQNGLFINCSSSGGVNVGSLDNAYWKKCFAACGRVKASLAKTAGSLVEGRDNR